MKWFFYGYIVVSIFAGQYLAIFFQRPVQIVSFRKELKKNLILELIFSNKTYYLLLMLLAGFLWPVYMWSLVYREFGYIFSLISNKNLRKRFYRMRRNGVI
jgi:hypothetical protein